MDIKNKLNKQAEQKQNHKYGDHLEGYQNGGKGTGFNEYRLVGTE